MILPVFISESATTLLLMLLFEPLKTAILSFLKVPDIFRSPPTSILPRLFTVEPLLIPNPWVNFNTPRLFMVELLLTVVPCEKVMVPQALLETVNVTLPWFQLLFQLKDPLLTNEAPLLSEMLFMVTVPLFVTAAEKVFAWLGVNRSE